MEIDWNVIYRINRILKSFNELSSSINQKEIAEGTLKIAEGISNISKLNLNETQTKELIKNLTNIDNLINKDSNNNDSKLSINEDNYLQSRKIIEMTLLSNDPVVRQARPKMMILLGKAAVIYSIFTPILVIIAAILKIDQPTIDSMVKLILWQGATLWGSFTTSFTGYTFARSVDKKTTADYETGTTPSKLLQKLSNIGHKIS